MPDLRLKKSMIKPVARGDIPGLPVYQQMAVSLYAKALPAEQITISLGV
jgi:hypothetical protein